MDWQGHLVPILSEIDDFIEIVIVGIFVIGSAIVNVLTKNAEKRRQEDLKREIERSGSKKKTPGPQRAQARLYQRLPYAKMAEKSSSAAYPKSSSSVLEQPHRIRPSKVSSPPSQTKIPPQDTYPRAKTAGFSPSAPKSVSAPVIPKTQQQTPERRDFEKPSSIPEAKAKPSTSPSSKMNIIYLREILKNPAQLRCLIAASEVLSKPLALR